MTRSPVISSAVVFAWGGLAWYGAAGLGDAGGHDAGACGLPGATAVVVCELHWLAMCFAMMLPSDARRLIGSCGARCTTARTAAALVGYALVWAFLGVSLRALDANVLHLAEPARFLPASTTLVLDACVVGLWMGVVLAAARREPHRRRASVPLLAGMQIASGSAARCWPIMVLCSYQDGLPSMIAFAFVIVLTDRLAGHGTRAFLIRPVRGARSRTGVPSASTPGINSLPA
ncbi:MAG TPA: hypothetical protein VFB22_01985 [Candidatus Baltobacteraceae bacterium]|nr:hypothetical protein [Candidatus Baltobacteraceae bacterium]